MQYFFDIFRLHIVEEFNRDIYDYIIASDESVFDAVSSTSSILYKLKTWPAPIIVTSVSNCILNELSHMW